MSPSFLSCELLLVLICVVALSASTLNPYMHVSFCWESSTAAAWHFHLLLAETFSALHSDVFA